MSKKDSKKKVYFWQGTVSRNILLVFILLSFVPIVFCFFLIVSSYQGIISDLQVREVITQDEVMYLKQSFVLHMFLLLLLMVVFMVLVGALVERYITRPLMDIVEHVKEVAEGNFKVKFRTKSKDEFGILASALNDMVSRLKEQRKREELTAKLKTEFMSIAAHQLRTPLSSIKWILKMTLDGDMGHISLRQRDFMEKAYGANERMIMLVNDLLNVTRIEEGRFGFEFSSIDFNKLVEGMLPGFEQQAKIRNVKFTYNPCKEDPLVLIVDPQRIKIALANLIDNAMHYTPIRGSVELSVKNKGDFIEVTVKDTGVGIPKNQESRVFSKFFRGDNVVRMQVQGTGLGLFLAKNIVEKHGGKIWFDSEEGKGTTFYFTIPNKKEELDLFPDDHV